MLSKSAAIMIGCSELSDTIKDRPSQSFIGENLNLIFNKNIYIYISIRDDDRIIFIAMTSTQKQHKLCLSSF